jgi:hypothetical protein
VDKGVPERPDDYAEIERRNGRGPAALDPAALCGAASNTSAMIAPATISAFQACEDATCTLPAG